MKEGFEQAKSLCLFAAISDEPEINSRTKVVRLNEYESEPSVTLDIPKQGSLYVKYPLDRNFVVDLSQIRHE